jgi:hypothetical protein
MRFSHRITERVRGSATDDHVTTFFTNGSWVKRRLDENGFQRDIVEVHAVYTNPFADEKSRRREQP